MRWISWPASLGAPSESLNKSITSIGTCLFCTAHDVSRELPGPTSANPLYLSIFKESSPPFPFHQRPNPKIAYESQDVFRQATLDSGAYPFSKVRAG